MKNKIYTLIASLCILSSSLSAIDNKDLNIWARCQLDICDEFICELSMMYDNHDIEMSYWFGKMQAYCEIIALTREQIDWELLGECECDDGDYEDVIY